MAINDINNFHIQVQFYTHQHISIIFARYETFKYIQVRLYFRVRACVCVCGARARGGILLCLYILNVFLYLCSTFLLIEYFFIKQEMVYLFNCVSIIIYYFQPYLKNVCRNYFIGIEMVLITKIKLTFIVTTQTYDPLR